MSKAKLLRTKPFLRLLLLFIIAFAGTVSLVAQDDEDTQSWNDLQISIPVNKKVDWLLFGTLRFSRQLKNPSETRLGSGVNWKATKEFSVSPTYLYIETRNLAGQFRTEHRLSLRGVYKFPVKAFGLSHRSVYEYRIRSSGNTWRYRPSLTVEKNLPKSFIADAKLFVTEEVFYVSTTRKFSRNRFSIGVSKTLNPKLSLDVYYMRQNDGFAHPGDLNVVGTSWKVKL